MNKKIFLNCISLAVLSSIFMTSNSAARTRECNDGALRGSYAMSFQGTMIKEINQVPVSMPVAMIGLSTFDGKGNVNSTIKMNRNGVSLDLNNVIGTYTMEPNCTGTALLIDTADLPIPLTVWAVSEGREDGDFIFTSTTPGIVGNGTAKKH
jgi:hypothetical protein